MKDEGKVEADTKEIVYPSLEKKSSKPSLHPALDLERWVKSVDLNVVASRVATEMNARGLLDAESIRRNPQQLVTVIQQALGIEAARLINQFLKES